MSNTSEQRSPFMRFLDAFFQEDNIKWMLGAGVCILLGSSLRLVTMHWNECTPVWKYLILLGYTGTLFPLGELSYHRLGLRKTGTCLMALTVLLIPLSFLALHWVRSHKTGLTEELVLNAGLTTLLGINLAWSAFAAQRIFRHFLRQVQPTFLVSYLILCVAGAVVPGLPTAWAPVLALALWAVFAAGTIKVNRHVFWLTEEHRLPRIFGFFPILLLGLQFLVVFTFGLASHLTPVCMGFLSALIALPILMTADTVARVFEQRTGGLVRPIPWSISGPLFLGIILCVAGLVLSLTGFPASTIAVPTAALVAIAMAIVAHRTQKSAFAWGMVVCAIVVYQTSPVYFKELVLQVRDQAAHAVGESRLPYAFYGLTYAPLIIVFSLVSKILKRRGQTVVADPLRLTGSMLPWILFGVSFTHPSAIMPVSLVLLPIFVGQAALFGQRILLVPAAMSFLAAAYGLPGFCERVLGCPLSAEEALLAWIAAAGLLFIPGVFVDRWSRSFAGDRTGSGHSWGSQNTCQLFSLAATFVASVVWVGPASWFATALQWHVAILISVMLIVLLITHALRWRSHRLAEWTLAFSTYILLQHLHSPAGFSADFSTLAYLLLMQWLLSYGLARNPNSRVSQTFAQPLVTISVCGLCVLFGLSAVIWIAAHVVPPDWLPWTTSTLVLVWGLDAARRLKNSLLAMIVWSSVFVFCSGAATAGFGPHLVSPWWIAIWVATGFALFTFTQTLKGALHLDEIVLVDESSDDADSFRSGIKVWLAPLSSLIPILFATLAIANLYFLDWHQRFAGFLALAGMYRCHRNRLPFNSFDLFWPLVNWNLLALVLTACVPTSMQIGELTFWEIGNCGLPLAAFAAISIWGVEWKQPRNWVQSPDIVVEHQKMLSLVTIGVLFCGLLSHISGGWGPAALAWAMTAWISIAAASVSNGLRTQRVDRVWAAIAVLIAAFIYFVAAGAWALSNPATPNLCLLVGLAFWSIGSVNESSNRFGILSIPAKVAGFWLPLFVIPFALWRHVECAHPTWAGVHSLPLLGAATFYFWRGLASRQLGITVLSAAILNLATALVWTELHWTDPQLFLIPIGISVLALTELMNREIPSAYHERLRLMGSLLILVSPTFHIVTGSWAHILMLMIASFVIALIAIGLRVRVLLYTSSAFLFADLVALVVRGSVDQPNLLWVVGVAFGASVIALGAICENHREVVLGRLRGMAAELELWH